MLCCRQNYTHSGSDEVRKSPNACLSVCNFRGRFSGILYRSNRPLWTPRWLFCLVTFALCHSSGECNFVGNTRPRTLFVWFNGLRVPRKGKVACKNIFPAFKWDLEPNKNISGTSNMPDYTGGIYLAIWPMKRNLSCFEGGGGGRGGAGAPWTSFQPLVIH